MIDWNRLYATRMARAEASEIRERMKLLASRSIIHLGGGLPDPAIFPYAELRAASDAILGDPARARTALQYAPSEGHPPLRTWIAERLSLAGGVCAPENVMITNGSQQAIDFVARLLVSPGDPVMVEVPSFIGALRAFDLYEPRYRALPEDMGALVALAPGAAKLCYVGTEFRNPTGTSRSLEERHALIDFALRTGTPLLEDGCYIDLRYDGEPLPSLFALGAVRVGVEDSPVLHAGTFSKTVAPSLRVGWIAGPRAVIRKLVLIKQAADLATSAINQMVLLDVAEAHLDTLVAHACGVYRERRDSMLAALARHMPEGTRWTRPEGGLYIWVTLPEGIDGDRLAQRALAEQDVSVISGRPFHPQLASGVAAPANQLRLSFSFIPSEPAAEGVARLGALARKMLGEGQSSSAAVTAISTT